jgi:hypothetical protein
MRSAELVWVAQTIACCGEIGGIGCRCDIAQRRVRPSLVVQRGSRTPIGPFVGSFCIGFIRGSSATSSFIRQQFMNKGRGRIEPDG